jgi:hypothetical protein
MLLGMTNLDRARSREELAVELGLLRLIESGVPLLYGMNVAVRVQSRWREVDFIVIYRGRAFGVEVDGPHHARRGRYAADHSKHVLLEDRGLCFVRRIAVEETTNIEEVDIFLKGCLDRLGWWAAA